MPIFSVIFVLLLSLSSLEVFAKEIVLSNDTLSVQCDPETLQLHLQSDGKPWLLVSKAQTNGAIAALKQTSTSASWQYPQSQTRVVLLLLHEELHVHIKAEKVGSFTFPILSPTNTSKGWILPIFEGVYVPHGDARWNTYLAGKGEMNTTADFTMPFLGWDLGDRTLTCIVTNPFNNQVTFDSSNTVLTARLTHEFTRNQPAKEYGVVFTLGDHSPVEPARIYRKWLKQRGDFVPMADKINETPDVAKLLGAPHIYVWGEEIISAGDILNWKDFAKALHAGAAPALETNPAQQIWSGLGKPARDAIITISQSEWADKYTKSLLLQEVNELLLQPGFYKEAAWRKVSMTPAIRGWLQKGQSSLTEAEVIKLNCSLVFAAFPKFLAPVENWGGGVSPKMMKMFSAAGLERLWMGSGSWKGFVQRPETVETARKLGFLVGPYDSYHSMHSPGQADTWETAQFGAEVYETGAIVNGDGTKRHGFQKKGYLLSPIAARPYVEKRVSGLMKQFAANSWFIDCDGFGEYFDDYSESHPATQLTDMLARRSRMTWIRDQYGVVLGTEGCSAAMASTVHFAHGVMTPVIGWGDPDLKEKSSPYYLGAYYPADEPAVFFKQVPIKDQYRHLFYEPQFRLPLFQTVFHDSVIATHHWSNPRFKFKEVGETMELLELLYNIPPLYHLNPAEFAKRKSRIKQHYDFFSPLHREAGILPMTAFNWLSKDRSVQQTTFGDRVTITANFGSVPFVENGKQVPPRSVVAERADGSRQVYQPAPN